MSVYSNLEYLDARKRRDELDIYFCLQNATVLKMMNIFFKKRTNRLGLILVERQFIKMSVTDLNGSYDFVKNVTTR